MSRSFFVLFFSSGSFVQRHDVNYRFYADDTLYFVYYGSINRGAFDFILRLCKSGSWVLSSD